MPEALPFVGGLIGASAGASAAPTPQVFQPSGTGAADTSWQALINGSIANNPYQTSPGQPQQYGQQAINLYNQGSANNLIQPFLQSAIQGGNAMGQVGQMATGAAPQINAGAMQTLQTGFDPQNALQQRMLQQLNDQTNVNSAQSGTTNSPYGASVANAADSNFGIDWQNAQLNRQLAALSGAGAGATSAANLGAAGAQDIAGAGAMPMAAENTVQQDQTNALQTLLGVLGNQGAGAYNNQNMNQLMQYLGLGAQQSNTQAGVTQNAFTQQMQGAAGGGLGGSILGNQAGGLISQAFGGGGGITNGLPLFG